MAGISANMMQVNFDSVMQLKEAQIVAVFEAIKDSGLDGFLGETLIICEPKVKEFVKNAKIEGEAVVSRVNGLSISINEEQFAGLFGLHSKGPERLADIPNHISDEMLPIFGK